MLLHDILRLTSTREPERTALICGEQTWTYRALAGRVNRLAHALLGVAGEGARVAILAENRPEVIDAYYGVPAAGMILTFLNYRLHARELAWILGDSGASVLLVEGHLLSSLRPELSAIESLARIVVIGSGDGAEGEVAYGDFVAGMPDTAPLCRRSDDDPAWLLYTSGTTGFPKGVVLSHRNLVASTVNVGIECAINEDDRALMSMPLCHISSHMLLTYHLTGATVVVQRRFESVEWMELVDRHRITMSALAPTLAINLLDHTRIDDYRLNSFRRLVAGAGAMPVAVLRRLMDRFGPVVCSAFGMTEVAGSVTQHPPSAFIRALQGEEHLLAACGRTMCLCEMKVVDDGFVEVPRGSIGEIVVRGDQVTRGYWNNATATDEAFTDGWLHTGDLGFQDAEGYFTVVDRLKDMIKSGGENVYSREVEEVLHRHDAVRDVAVIALPDEKWGERVAAVIVPAETPPAAEELVAFCRQELAGFKIPRQIFFVEDLPRNASGKVLKRDLRTRFQDEPHGARR